MPIFIEANYAKKVGLPDYSSHQFAVTLRTELSDLSQLEKTSAELYARLQQAVDSQIVNPGYVPGQTAPANKSTTPAAPAPAPRGEDSWKCSDKQRDLILKIVDEHRLNKDEVDQLAQTRFGVGVKQLNKLQASSLIDELIETHGHTGASGRSGGFRPAYGRNRHDRHSSGPVPERSFQAPAATSV